MVTRRGTAEPKTYTFRAPPAALGALATIQVPDRTAAQWTAGRERAVVAVARDLRRLLRAVRRAERRHDLTVAYLHYGTERG